MVSNGLVICPAHDKIGFFFRRQLVDGRIRSLPECGKDLEKGKISVTSGVIALGNQFLDFVAQIGKSPLDEVAVFGKLIMAILMWSRRTAKIEYPRVSKAGILSVNRSTCPSELLRRSACA